MASITCKKCGKQISPEDKSCPYCRKRRYRLVGMVIVALTIGTVAATKIAVTVMMRGPNYVADDWVSPLPLDEQQLGFKGPISGYQVSKISATNPMNQYFDQQQSIEITKLAYLAVGCQVLTEDEADALFTIGLKNAYDGARAMGRVPQSGDLSLFKAKSDGIASATNYGACDSFSTDPDQVTALRKQAQSAKTELARLGQTDYGIKNQ
jgi:RNA polymerase subunit RPABC4/transcription elongation factor Spt4